MVSDTIKTGSLVFFRGAWYYGHYKVDWSGTHLGHQHNEATIIAAGFFPRHLPDSYTGQVVLADLNLATIPAQVRGVRWHEDTNGECIFWVPSTGGDLTTLGGGHMYNYMVEGGRT